MMMYLLFLLWNSPMVLLHTFTIIIKGAYGNVAIAQT